MTHLVVPVALAGVVLVAMSAFVLMPSSVQSTAFVSFLASNKKCVQASTGKMAGFKLNYTTQGTGKVAFSLDFGLNIHSITSVTYALTYGTGNAPKCGAPMTGTHTGDDHDVFSTVLNSTFVEVDFYAASLTPNTTYWVDISTTQSNGGPITYYDAELMTVETA
jgi:hypothetical protein